MSDFSFSADNDLASYFLGVCQDFKHFGFAVSVIILNESGDKIVRILRKEACYVRFALADRSGNIPYILYANWRNTVNPDEVDDITERIKQQERVNQEKDNSRYDYLLRWSTKNMTIRQAGQLKI